MTTRTSKPVSARFDALGAQAEVAVPPPYSPGDRVYLLRAVCGDIRFSPLQWEGCERHLVKIFRAVQTGRSSVAAVSRAWRTPKSDGRVSTWNDCPMVGAYFPAVSSRAADALADLLEGQAALLPVTHGRRTYHIVVPRVSRSALDEPASVSRFEFSWEGYTQPRYARYVFHREELPALSVFTIPGEPCKMFVTDRFVQRVVERRLVGFSFQIVFPLRPRERWDRLADRSLREHLSEGLPKGQSVSGARVVVRFMLDHPNRIPRPGEERAVRAWAAEADRALWDEKSADVPRGFLHRVEPDTGDCKVIFCGPDSADLRTRLQALAQSTRWAAPVWVGRDRVVVGR